MKKPKKKECAEVRDGTGKKNPYNNVMINYVLSLNIFIYFIHKQRTGKLLYILLPIADRI